ncbi:MAG TPA: pyrroloquinoline quinone biosynthesis protein PqqE [Verrucomicrobiae bacterium]|nr:pyrroloquinoline quinone biosynthesis protein PqqE [Verrucomicrobiae bacterium]
MHPRPYLLLAELTYRCPLHCPYCSNPPVSRTAEELSTADWRRVLREAAQLGTLHVGFSGGEPLNRPDLEDLVKAARTAGLYSNLITSAVGLSRSRAEALKAAGLDAVQISFQSDLPGLADQIAGARAHAKKLEAARHVRELGFPLTMNVVLHRANIDRLPHILALAEEIGADRIELANTQFYGWAFRNRAALLPSRRQIDEALRITEAARQRLIGKLEILFVVPDYYSDRPKPCMHGWASRYLTVNPMGDVLPCPTASEIRDLRFDNVQSKSLSWIWHESDAFNHFRGTEWMPEPCRSCEFREVDFGGCRCQAALLTGDARNTDPVCGLSPEHQRLSAFVESIRNNGTGESADQVLENVAFRQNPAR